MRVNDGIPRAGSCVENSAKDDSHSKLRDAAAYGREAGKAAWDATDRQFKSARADHAILRFPQTYREGRKEQPTREARKTVGVKFFCIKTSQGIVHPRV